MSAHVKLCVLKEDGRQISVEVAGHDGDQANHVMKAALDALEHVIKLSAPTSIASQVRATTRKGDR